MALSAFLFTALLLVKLETHVDIPWLIVFIPCGIINVLFVILWYDLRKKIRNNSHYAFAKTFTYAFVFFFLCFLLVQFFIIISLSTSWECRHDETRVVQVQDTAMLSTFCSCHSEDLVYLLEHADFYWKSDVNVTSPATLSNDTEGPCGDRHINPEEIIHEYLGSVLCQLEPVVQGTNQKVRVEIGEECEKVIPTWVIITPILLIIITVLYMLRANQREIVHIAVADAEPSVDVDDFETFSDDSGAPRDGTDDTGGHPQVEMNDIHVEDAEEGKGRKEVQENADANGSAGLYHFSGINSDTIDGEI